MSIHFFPRNKKSFLIFLLLIPFQFIFSQNPIIKGFVVDETKTPLEFASVALLQPQDSVMVSFAITGSKGEFELTDSPTGTFLLQIYLIGHAPYYHKIEFKNKTIDLRTVILKATFEELNEITITAVIPVQIKNDTIVFNPKSFKIHHDDTIKDLLKKLPGIELDNQGNIFSQGNEVTKIYVDGKEFFSGDPSIVLKNLAADVISKIEVIDKKSDQAELTGVNDDEKSFVINLTLKKNKKNNGFGKAAIGAGLDNKYFSNLNFNNFNSKTQFSVIGKYNNINITGSNIQDFLESSGGLTDDLDEEEDSNSLFEKRKRSLSGNLTAGVGGVNFGVELKKKEVINVDYFYNFLENKGTSTSQRISFSNLKRFNSESENQTHKTTNNHNFNFNYENKSNKNSRLFIKGSISSDISSTNHKRNISFFNELDELSNTNDISNYSTREKENGRIKINYYKKISDKKRNFNSGISIFSSSSATFIDQNNIYTRVSNQVTNNTNTTKNQYFKNNNLIFQFGYTEPLGGNHFLKLQTFFTFKQAKEDTNQEKLKNNIEQTPLIYLIQNKEESYNSKLSYIYSSKVLNFNIGSELQQLYRKIMLTGDHPILHNYTYLNPSASLKYKPKKGINYRLIYRKTVRSPGNYQSAPIINDLNPYHIRMGNPNLDPQKFDNITFNSSIHNFKNSLSVFSKISYIHIKNAIIPNLIIDQNYVQTRSYINQGNQDRFSALFNINKRYKPLGIRYNLNLKGANTTSNSIVDKKLNDVKSSDYSIGVGFENNKKNFIDIKSGFNYGINKTSFSVIENLDRDYIKKHFYAKFDFDISKKLNINSQFDYYSYNDNKFDSNQKIPFWNASVSYSFTKNKNGTIKLLLIDILDKNLDIIRKSTVNYFEETTNQVLGRYFILSMTMRLNSKSRSKKKIS